MSTDSIQSILGFPKATGDSPLVARERSLFQIWERGDNPNALFPELEKGGWVFCLTGLWTIAY